MENKVWLIIRPHYSPLGVLESIGICGSGFFIKSNIFISSAHVLNESSFLPNAYSFNEVIFLINPVGKKIEIMRKDIYKLIPEIDITLIKINGDWEYFEIERVYSKGDEVKNIGYPSKDIKDIFENFRIKKQFEQAGKILTVYEDYTMNADDVKISNKKVIILDHSSELGFSGGPLLKDGKVIGIMSHLYPQNKNAVAVAIEEIVTEIEVEPRL